MIDPTIPLGVQPPAPANPMAWVALAQQRQDQQALEQERQAQAQQMQQAQADAAHIHSIIQGAVNPDTGNFNSQKAANDLRLAGYADQADKVEEAADKHVQAAAKQIDADAAQRLAARADLTQQAKQMTAIDDAGRPVPPSVYQSFVTNVAKTLGPQLASSMPTQFQRPFVDHAISWGETEDQTDKRLQAVAGLASTKTKTAADQISLVKQALGDPTSSAQDNDAILGGMELAGQVSPEIAASVKGKSGAQISQMFMTPDARQSADTTAAGQAETARHNQATEAETRQRLSMAGGTNANPDDVAAWVRQLRDPSSGAQIGQIPTNLRTAVMRQLQPGEVTKLTAQNQAVKEFAGTVLPHIQPLSDMAEQLDKLGLMGTAGGVFRKLAAGQSYAADVENLTTDQRELVGKFATEAGLFVSATARAHGGARGGASPQMITYLKTLLDPSQKDLATYKGNLAGAQDYLSGYAKMGESETPTSGGGGTSTTYTGERRQADDGRILGKVGDKVVELTQKPDGSWVVK